jgi:hypothetical protein
MEPPFGTKSQLANAQRIIQQLRSAAEIRAPPPKAVGCYPGSTTPRKRIDKFYPDGGSEPD